MGPMGVYRHLCEGDQRNGDAAYDQARKYPFVLDSTSASTRSKPAGQTRESGAANLNAPCSSWGGWIINGQDPFGAMFSSGQQRGMSNPKND